MRDHKIYLQDILDSMESIEIFTKGMTEEDFRTDDKTFSAVINKLEIIGEAVKQLPEEIRQNNPDVPWSEMAGMRDRLIHAYFRIDYDLIWKTAKERIPQVKPSITKILEQF